MYKSKVLSNIPYTLEALGNPYQVGEDNSSVVTTGTPAINYAFKVTIDTAIDIPIGRVGSNSALNYGSQPKIVRGSDGTYWCAYTGLKNILSQDFVTDPSWTNTESFVSYDSTGKLYNLTIPDGNYGRAGESFGDDFFQSDRDYSFRFQISIPTHPGTDTYDAYPAFGVYDGNFVTEATASTVGFVLSPSLSGNTWQLTLRKQGTSDLVRIIGQIPQDSVIFLDMVIHRDTERVEGIAYHDGQLVGRVVSEEGYYDYSTLTPDHCGVWGVNASGGSTDFESQIFSFQAWESNAVIKTSIDNGRSWKSLPTTPFTGDFDVIGEVSIDIDTGNELYLVYSIISTSGDTSGFYRIYKYQTESGSGQWDNQTTISLSTGAYSRTNPSVSIDVSNSLMHTCWQSNPGSGSNIHYRDTTIIPS